MSRLEMDKKDMSQVVRRHDFPHLFRSHVKRKVGLHWEVVGTLGGFALAVPRLSTPNVVSEIRPWWLLIKRS